MGAINLQAITVTHPSPQLLKRITLVIPKGEMFVLTGINGAGKSTLIKALLGLVPLGSGTITIFENNHNTTKAREHIAYLPERFTPPYYLKGRDYLKYMLGLYRQSYDASEVHALFDALDLKKTALNQPVRQYSKGMAQKLGLAACFLSKKPLLILDEPMSGLDPKARHLVKAHIKELHQQGTTFFMNSHMLEDVDTLADRLAILHDGELVFNGDPASCKSHFQSATLESAFIHAIDSSPQDSVTEDSVADVI